MFASPSIVPLVHVATRRNVRDSPFFISNTYGMTFLSLWTDCFFLYKEVADIFNHLFFNGVERFCGYIMSICKKTVIGRTRLELEEYSVEEAVGSQD